ncbi:hypothetical protein MMC10_008244 [Thelotrema lepadinum]|nr:hypothetical protein [Thelotrema lepadinum]
MHLKTLLTTLSLTLLPSLVASQSNYPNQSAPFNLFLTSTNTTLNNTPLYACHSGAAIESLCIDTSNNNASEFDAFYFNYTTLVTPSYGGILTWNLVGSNFVENEPMVFIYSPTSNVAQPLLYPDYEQAQLIQFDKKTGAMGIPLQQVDTVVPPYEVTPGKNGFQPVYRWYVCTTYFGSYTYETLAWKMGNEAAPENPSCQSVGVKRVFIKT